MKVIIIFSFLLTCTLNAQVNLVVKPSFEDTISCPQFDYDYDAVFNWSVLINGGGSPDVFHTCCPNSTSAGSCSLPKNVLNSFQYPKSGNAFSGLMTFYGTNGREYIQGELSTALNVGSIYCVVFYVNLRNNSKHYCNSIGAYFDNGSVSTPTAYGVANVTPQIFNTIQELDDTLNWIKIEGSFTATGTEEYVTIGNFLTDAMSDMGIFSTDNPTPYAYYNIDDVSVIDMSTPAQAGNDTIIHPGESVFIGRQPEIGLNEACIWFVDGVPIDTIAGMWVTPEETTTYVLQQTLCGEVKYDTVTVVVDEFASVFEYSDISGDLILYPNPSTGEVWFDLKENTDDLRGIAIYSLEGMLLHTELPQGNKINFAFSSGAYIVVVTTKSASYRERVVIIN